MKNTALVIMAAGIGSRFGGGIKQLEPVGPNGEIIMDYSIHDAMEAGFNKVIFIIRRDLEKDFKEIIGHRIEKLLPVEYAYQELEDLPAGYPHAWQRPRQCVIRHLLRLGGYGPAGRRRGLHGAGKRAGADGGKHRKHPSRL